ncbi:MAG: hypothetical protein JO298_00690 [Verrucomicrobia bacterium]|nr:hypothetical protein [Verrucomicrobiota bacterium]
MNESFEPTVDSSRGAVASFGAQAKEKILTQVRREPVKTFTIILAASILLSVLVGYQISQREEESRRQRLIEDWMREVTDWIRQHGHKLGNPLKGGLEAAKSAVEEVSKTTARVGRQWQPALEKQKRSFLNLF